MKQPPDQILSPLYRQYGRCDQQTVDDLILTDELPKVPVVSVTSITGHGSTTQTQLSTPSTSAPGGVLEYEFDQVVGTGSNDDVKLVFEYFVTQQDQNGQPVIPLNTGGTKLITNTSSASGTWTSSNPNFSTPQSVSSSNSPDTEYNLTARTVSLQKSFQRSVVAARTRLVTPSNIN